MRADHDHQQAAHKTQVRVRRGRDTHQKRAGVLCGITAREKDGIDRRTNGECDSDEGKSEDGLRYIEYKQRIKMRQNKDRGDRDYR